MNLYPQVLCCCLLAFIFLPVGTVVGQEFKVSYGGQVTRTWNWTDGSRHRITLNASGTVVLRPKQITCDGQSFLSSAADLITTNRVWGTAVQDGSAQTEILEFDATRLVSRASSSTSSRFTSDTASYLYFVTEDSVSTPPNDITVYAWEYLSSQSVLRLWVALSNPFYYPDASYEHYDFPASHVVNGQGNARSCMHGTVVDSQGTAVSGAQVMLGGATRTTDALGRFDYHEIPPGSYQLSISKAGYINFGRIETVPGFSILQPRYELGGTTFKILDANPLFLGQTLLPAPSLDASTLSAVANGSLERSIAVADGATRLLLRHESATSGTVTFAQTGPTGGQLVAVVGSSSSLGPQRTIPVNGKHMAFALYRVPEGIPFRQANTPFPMPRPTVSFTATFVPDFVPTQTLQKQQVISLAPTPVVLVHGLWGKRGDWSELEADLQWYSVPVLNFDYSSYNANSFAQNTWVIPRASASLIVDLRNKGYAATKVDVVAHSMGGILTRIASNLRDYRSRQNFHDGYIRRAIPVDTPHHGAPSASFLVRYLKAFTNDKDLTHRLFWMHRTGKPPDRGAVRDLDPSTFGESLGGIATNAMRVPSHTIFCEATEGGDVDPIWEIGIAASPIYGWRKDFLDENLLGRNPGLRDFKGGFEAKRRDLRQTILSASTTYLDLWKTVFSGQPNDGTVAVVSQIGGSDVYTEHKGVSGARQNSSATPKAPGNRCGRCGR